MRQSSGFLDSTAQFAHILSTGTESRKLQKYDVVITSYPTCAGEWPNRKKRANKKSAAGDDSDDDDEAAEELARQAGPLFDPDYMFYRSKCWSSTTSSKSRLTGAPYRVQSFSTKRTRSRTPLQACTEHVELSDRATAGA